MTPEQEALVEKMLDLFVRKVPVKKSLCLAEAGLVSHRRLSEEEERAALEGKITPYVLTNVGMFELTPTDSGELVLAVAAERERWRLRSVWQEACHKWERAMRLHHRDVVWDDEINRLESAAVQARAAYVAAGGEV